MSASSSMTRTASRTGALLALAAALSACGGGKAVRPDPMLSGESFDSDSTYSRSFAATPPQACEAGRRTLLSQGYVVVGANGDAVQATKNFQPQAESHEQLEIRVSCVSHGAGQALVFITALRDRYSLKKSPTSASVGVGAFGSVSLPVGSSDDSLVRVASSTVQDAAFYNRFFERVTQYLPVVPANPPPATVAPPAPVPAASNGAAVPPPTDLPADVPAVPAPPQ